MDASIRAHASLMDYLRQPVQEAEGTGHLGEGVLNELILLRRGVGESDLLAKTQRLKRLYNAISIFTGKCASPTGGSRRAGQGSVGR